MSAPEAIATVAAAALSQAASQQTGPTGSVVTHNSDGTKTITGSVLATDATGTSVTTATHVGDTTPPGVPTGITAWSGDGTVHVAWDGTLTGGIPADFDHVTLLANGTAFAVLASAGSATCKAVPVGATVSVTATSEDDVCAIDGTPAHNVSAACTAVSVAVTDTADGLSKLIRETNDGVDVGKSADGTTYAAGTSVTRQGTDGTFSILKMLSGVLAKVASFGEGVVTMCRGRIGIYVDADGESSFGIFGTTTPTLMGGAYLARDAANLTGVTMTDAAVGAIGVGKDNSGRVTAHLCAQDVNLYGENHLSERAPMTRFATAVQPTVLYNGGAARSYDVTPGAGTAGTVSLSESAANFRELVIWYSADTGAITELNPMFAATVPVAAWVCISKVFWQWDAGKGANCLQFSSATYQLSGTTMRPTRTPYGNMYSGGSLYVDAGYTGGSIQVRRVMGRR